MSLEVIDGNVVHYPQRRNVFSFDEEVSRIFPDTTVYLRQRGIIFPIAYQRKIPMAHALNLVGKVFGRLTVIAQGSGKYGRPSWSCRCSCGSEVDVGRGNLQSGSTVSCGCYSRHLLASRSRTHGLSSTGAYASWSKMMQRCYDTRHPYFREYGGKGVGVAPRWHTFENFYEDMGERPAGTTLDRRRNTLGYSRDNCRWATRKEQANNTSSNHIVHYRRRRYTFSVLAGMFGIEPATLRKRLLRMPAEKAVQMQLYERV